MVRRHPWVFGGEKINSTEEGEALWARIKMQEKAKKTLTNYSKTDINDRVSQTRTENGPNLIFFRIRFRRKI